MGLDQVELILRVEEVFGISISDEEAGDVRTVGDLHEIVCWKLDVDSAPSVQCVNLLAFHRLRSALTGELSIPRSAVRREAQVKELVPRQGRRRRWRDLQAHMRLLLPSLERPNWLIGISIAVAVTAGLGAV